MNQILYGIGKAVLREFTNRNNILALSKLKNLSVDFGASSEPVTGGDSSYPIATFPKEKSIKISAENATFDMSMLNATQGAVISTGVVAMTEIMTVNIPADGIINLEYEPKTGTNIVITGYAKVTTDPLTKEFKQDDTDKKKLTFALADAGKEIDLIYERDSSENASTMSILEDTLSKPFEFTHRIPIFDDNNQVVGQGQLIIYKAQANNSFQFGLQPQTAFAPKMEFEALNPKRPDGKFWDFTIDPVA